MFRKALAGYYIPWFKNCHESARYCRERGDEARAQQYLEDAKKFLTIIMENWDAIEFFSVGDRAFIRDTALPVEFRGYV